MTSAMERLHKILKLETAQGYRDKSVIGGLERLADRWRGDALQEAESSAQGQLVEEIVAGLERYPDLTTKQERKDMIATLQELAGFWDTADDWAARQAHLRPESPSAELETSEDGHQPAPEAARAKREATLPTSPEVVPTAVQRDDMEAALGSRPTPVGTASLQASISRLPGVGPSYTKRLVNLGVRTIGDMLWLFPRRYDDYSNLKAIAKLRPGEDVTVIANLWSLKSRPLPGRNATIVTAILSDSTATIQASWFNPYVVKQLRAGRTYVFSGRVETYKGQYVLRNPAWEPVDQELLHTGRLVPVYPLTKGISARWMRVQQKAVVDTWGKRVHDHLPQEVRERARLLPLGAALEQIHFPDSQQQLEAARRRLAFDELFLIQVGVLRQRQAWQSLNALQLSLPPEAGQAFDQTLPFQFTGAQAEAAQSILQDMAASTPMSRLLQGDVGSGKTAVAAKAMWAAAINGVQSAMMAPTEILAEQHYRGLSRLFSQLSWQGHPLRVALLTGSQKTTERLTALEALRSGQIDIAVGTHALIQEGVEFHNLGLAVIDEQHRFGVRQRSALRQKGESDQDADTRHERPVNDLSAAPHLLVMSATPIPRTLSLTIYGDLDLSIIDEMPPGRQPIKTRWLIPRERERAYAFLRRQVESGRQAFIVYPLVEESESLSARAAVPEYEQLSTEVFPDLRLGLLHGRMKGEEKDAIMQAMQRGDIDVLVATSVVEVGIDVPNATVIMIEDAERFGLAQLHQFRGRVGRGAHASYCILISDSTTPNAVERLHAMEEMQDGFALAEKDLQLRGPGDFFGVRQSGLPDLKLAQVSDLRLLELARTEAGQLLERDPDLSQPQHRALARKVSQFWQGEGDIS